MPDQGGLSHVAQGTSAAEPAVIPASALLGRNVARIASNGEWEEGLVLCDDGPKGLVVKFPTGPEHHSESMVSIIYSDTCSYKD